MKQKSMVLEIKGGGNRHYEVIDYLKGFSILTIVLLHLIQYISFPEIIQKLSKIGGTGVHVFFFCSGFGLFNSYAKEEIGLFNFLKRRFVKIYVPYILVILLTAVVSILLTMLNGKEYLYSGNILLALMSHIFLFKMFVPSLEYSFGGQMWYMSTLFQFYFVFILIYQIKKKLRNDKLFAIFSLAISVIWWIFIVVIGINKIRIWNSFFLQYLWEFSLGMCIADYLRSGRNIKINGILLSILSVVGIGFATIMINMGQLFETFNDIFAVVGYTSLALLIYIIIQIFMPKMKKNILYISKISYEWYLLHILVYTIVFAIVAYMMGEIGLIMQIVSGIVAFILSILFAELYHRVWQQR